MESSFQPGERIAHTEYGEGVVLESGHDGYLRAFFGGSGERRVPIASIRRHISRTERISRGVDGGVERARRAWLSFEAHALPVMESASAPTSAKIDLLPHQVVLTHRIATASPRRYLIADEVDLGKTIETALILRELASRGELERALMIVPAGLVNNWHRELNEVFNLGFEVFGSEGDITDRKTNAFAKHDRLIASIDTLKRPARIKRLLEAPRWDLVVFDEAHHLTAYRTGGKIRKTENYKLAEALKGHSRDLLLLSATPHQGNHFQFWMLIQLLNPTLFVGPDDMAENRHRLNTVMFRRTKADACQPDGSPLFARRWVHTESFLMCQEERLFYEKLREYLEDGFDLARRQGNQGRALGFLMAIFQKIAASTFSSAIHSSVRPKRKSFGWIGDALAPECERKDRRFRNLSRHGRPDRQREALSDPELKRTKVELEAALSNPHKAREVVFDLFQDLAGFSLDDYKPFSDVSCSLDRLVKFLSGAVAERKQRLVKVGDGIFDLIAEGGDRIARFTLNRDAASGQDSLDLMGLDHPLVQEELGRWRSLPPEQVGVAVFGDTDGPVLLSIWMVEISAGNGTHHVVIQPIAIRPDGTRAPIVERQCEHYLGSPVAAPYFTTTQRLELFQKMVEPTLQREHKHRGAADGDQSYSAELIGYVEIVR